jgi:hypothetical protein
VAKASLIPVVRQCRRCWFFIVGGVCFCGRPNP